MQHCSSLFFELPDESPIKIVLKGLSRIYYKFFVYFIFYVGPILVLMNLFAIFILTRKQLRTAYTIIFLSMALDQSIAILCQDLLLLNEFLYFDSKITQSFAYEVPERFISILGPMCSAHATWLAVIITFVRLRHITSSTGEPSSRFIIMLCSISFTIVFLVGIPQFFFYDISWDSTNGTSEDGNENGSYIVFIIIESNRVYENDCLLQRIAYISSGVFYNALPCSLLMILSVALAYRLRKIRKMHADVMMGRSSPVNAESVRSSWMIAMIVLTTLITGIPQAIVNIVVGSMSELDADLFSINLSALIVTLVIFSSAINLAIYLCMSKRIREVTMSYISCVCRKVKSKKITRVISSPIPPRSSNNFTVSTIAR